DKCLHLSPQRLRCDVMLLPELATELRLRRRLVIASEDAERATEHGCKGGEQSPLPVLRQEVAERAEVPRSRVEVAGERRDVRERELPAVGAAGELQQPIARHAC